MTANGPTPEAQGGKFLFIRTMPGISRGNMWSYVLAAFSTIGLLTFIAIGTPYVLNNNLGLPTEVQGRVTGDLQLLNEIVLLLAFAPLGILADRIGRRGVYAWGLAAMGLGFFLYPLASSVPELGLYRAIYAIGIAAATGMLGTIVADYPQNQSRAKLVALGGVLNAVGVIIVALGFGRIPKMLVDRGFDTVTAGRYAHWLIAAICVVVAVIVGRGLKGGVPVQRSARKPLGELIRAGIAEGRNPRIALAYACGFLARADLVILGTFTVLWGQTAALQDGMDAAHASAVGSRLFGTASVAALLWLPIMGFILDRMNRVSGVILSMSIAAVGYLSMLLVKDPASTASIGWFALLGVGQISAFLGATTLISYEAPIATRGTVIGMFNVSGAVGILLSTGIGGRLFDTNPAWPFVMVGLLAVVVTLFAAVVRSRAPGDDRGSGSSAGPVMIH